ncbi:MAG TPA: response regulator [Terriglobales bacterium]|nr:response regulator [Terriglobales bacterium]
MNKRKYKLLVVDDEPSVLFTYRLLLEREGYVVAAVVSWREAVRELAESRFDMVLCDLSLEEQHSGFEVIEEARRRQPGAPCVLLTGYANVEAAQHAEKINVPVLYKPIDVKEFLTTIATVLRDTYAEAKTGSGR